MRNGCLSLFATLITFAPALAQQEKPAAAPTKLASPYMMLSVGSTGVADSPDAAPTSPAAMSPSTEAGRSGSCPEEWVWARAEYLLWFMRGASTPPLVTTGPAVGRFPGALGPGTDVLFGGRQVN